MKTVLLSAQQTVQDSQKEGSDLEYLEKELRKFFQYEGNVSITITFHKYHRSPCDNWIEMSSDEEVDKLKVVVTPRLGTPSSFKSIEQIGSESAAGGRTSKSRLQPRRLGSDEESDTETVLTTPTTQ